MDLKTNTYQEALDYLYSFVDYSLTRNFRFSPDKFDLGRMEAFLEILGNPHKAFPVIHVAGTKGKGSTSAMIASCLRAGGYRVGLFTSPHLQEFTERIRVNGEMISPEELVGWVNFVRPLIPKVEHLTTFEISTAIGFLHFQRAKVDAAVIEVGLGGRLDATNVVDPLVSVITSLSFDHMAVLGDTLEKIAYEKAGIIKPGHPVVMAPQVDEARQVIEKVASERGCRLVQVERDFRFTPGAHSLDGQFFRIQRAFSGSAEIELFIPLLGMHQVENSVTAYSALQLVHEQGLVLSDEAIHEGFARVSWPGRFEVIHRSPPVIVDSAHNRDSARRLRQAMIDYLPDRPVFLIFGASEDKDISGMFAELLPICREVVLTRSIHPRSLDPASMLELVKGYGFQSVSIASIEEAITSSLQRAGNDGVVLVAGSLFIAAAVRNIWLSFADRPAASRPGG